MRRSKQRSHDPSSQRFILSSPLYGFALLCYLALSISGCAHVNDPYSSEEVARMKAEAAMVKEPGGLSPDIQKKQAEAMIRLRTKRPTPPPPPNPIRRKIQPD